MFSLQHSASKSVKGLKNKSKALLLTILRLTIFYLEVSSPINSRPHRRLIVRLIYNSDFIHSKILSLHTAQSIFMLMVRFFVCGTIFGVSIVVENIQLITQHLYTIGKKDYVVNSVFDLGSKHTVIDGVKRLIDNDFDSAA